MSQIVINDLDFYQGKLPDLEQVKGSTYTPHSWDWSAFFDFDFDSDGISSFAVGNISAYAIAIGPIIRSSFNS